MDKAFAGCSIPQEKSNADINYELGISDADEDAYDAHLNHKGVQKGLEYGLLPGRWYLLGTSLFVRNS